MLSRLDAGIGQLLMLPQLNVVTTPLMLRSAATIANKALPEPSSTCATGADFTALEDVPSTVNCSAVSKLPTNATGVSSAE